MPIYEQKYLKRIGKDCFLDYDDKKVEVDEFGEEISGNLDCSGNHKKADIILTDLLKELGYYKLIDKFNLINKWYD